MHQKHFIKALSLDSVLKHWQDEVKLETDITGGASPAQRGSYSATMNGYMLPWHFLSHRILSTGGHHYVSKSKIDQRGYSPVGAQGDIRNHNWGRESWSCISALLWRSRLSSLKLTICSAICRWSGPWQSKAARPEGSGGMTMRCINISDISLIPLRSRRHDRWSPGAKVTGGDFSDLVFSQSFLRSVPEKKCLCLNEPFFN